MIRKIFSTRYQCLFFSVSFQLYLILFLYVPVEMATTKEIDPDLEELSDQLATELNLDNSDVVNVSDEWGDDGDDDVVHVMDEVAGNAAGSNTHNILDDGQRNEIEKTALIAYSLYAKYKIKVNVINVLDIAFPKQMFHNKTPILMKEAKNLNEKKLLGKQLQNYISSFFEKTGDENFVADQHAHLMLANLNDHPPRRIMDDVIITKPSTIHIDLNRELVQFYTFWTDHPNLVLNKVDGNFCDERFNLSGKYNATFKFENNANELMLYDWTRSARMNEGSLDLYRKKIQLNIYQYMLERNENVKIARKVCVVFHKNIQNYQIHVINDDFASHLKSRHG